MNNIINTAQKDDIPSRIKQLKQLMHREGISIYMVMDSDPHNSEYVGDYFKCRRFMSGFTGSNGTLIVTEDEACLWTDGRYFIQADRELEGSGIRLCKMGEPNVPTIDEYLKSTLRSGDVLGFDGRCMRAKDGIDYAEIAKGRGALVNSSVDLVSEIWTDHRPRMSMEPVAVIDDDIAGESVASKIGRIREAMVKQGAGAHVLSRLDDICYLLNIRGRDVECTPVVLSYLYMTMDEVHLFIQDGALDARAKEHFALNGVSLHPYESFYEYIKSRGSADIRIIADYRALSYELYACLRDKSAIYVTVLDIPNPTEEMEAVRNEKQLERIRDVYIRDSAALTRFIYRIKKEIRSESGGVINEYEAAMMLDGMRAQIPGFMELSFPTISAYGENAAMMHYEASQDVCADLKKRGMYLVDSGGQYMGGTTDVTRTVALGEVTDDMKKDFTCVCMGMLRLADAVFMEGCTGRNLDILARAPLWRLGRDYKCGTGHGVGYMLGVHTGPQNIRYRYVADAHEAVLKAGMTLSDEPGVYIEGQYGIRTENILEVKDAYTTPDGHFLKFDHLTWVPIDLELIDTSYMDKHDIELLNEYHRAVRERIMSFMESIEERDWLTKATSEIS